MKLVLILLLIINVCPLVPAQPSGGPKRGTLIVTGGVTGPSAIERFVKLAGGPDANFVYIPTAASSVKLDSGFIYEPPDSDTPAANTTQFEDELARMFGVKRIKVLHTRNRQTANSSLFVQALKTANGLWLGAGNAGRLANAYLDTLTQREIVSAPSRDWY
jgi:cyanophycinase